MAVGLRHFTERSGDGTGWPALDADNGEEPMDVQEHVSIVLGSQPARPPGTLYISSRRVIWLNDSDINEGYAVDFLSISLHAVSRDPDAYPLPCIYAQIESEEADDDYESDGMGSESNSELVELSKIKEMRLAPSDPKQLDRLFEMFCECAELNPELMEDEEEEDGWVFSADQVGAGPLGQEYRWNLPGDLSESDIGYGNGHPDLANKVLQLEINDKRFEDAEEMESDKKIAHQ